MFVAQMALDLIWNFQVLFLIFAHVSLLQKNEMQCNLADFQKKSVSVAPSNDDDEEVASTERGGCWEELGRDLPLKFMCKIYGLNL